ncbi:hypothetical protein TGAM01_v204152 [Trichoderma gamsii]|uniref:Uncharacterized protein n=1 Tax=Trichoderma gamsii TaxID=398673 RepID=A0A2P4ZSH8_9HYPO|nr:hypothetical protein TGAM01_v204152 [Trichoderma gamsii]PON27203.1 hypothetical protein TGAM01_v204152 [Trichoderma gamsii]
MTMQIIRRPSGSAQVMESALLPPWSSHNLLRGTRDSRPLSTEVIGPCCPFLQ